MKYLSSSVIISNMILVIQLSWAIKCKLTFSSGASISPNTTKIVIPSIKTATIVGYKFNDSTSGTYTFIYNFTSQQSVTIQSMRAWTMTSFQEFPGYNTKDKNIYFLNSQVTCLVYENNFTFISSSTFYSNTTMSIIGIAYGNSTDIYYQFIQNTSEIIVKECIRSSNSTNFTCAVRLNIANQTGRQIRFTVDKLLILSSDPAWNNVKLRVISASFTLISTLSIPSSSLAYRMQPNTQYIVLYCNCSVLIYNISNNYTLCCNLPILGTAIWSIQVTNVTLFISVDNRIEQYSILNGQLFTSSLTPNNSTSYSISRILTGDSVGQLVLWKHGVSEYFFYIWTETYLCDYSLGCNCMAGYCFYDNFTECFYANNSACINTQPTISTPVINLTNATNNTANLTTIASNTTGTANSTNNLTIHNGSTNASMVPGNTNNNSIFNTSNGLDMYISSSCFQYNSTPPQNKKFCQQYCKYSCKNCHANINSCYSCDLNFYQFVTSSNSKADPDSNSDDNGRCELKEDTKKISAFIAFANLLRIQNAQRMYFFILSLQLYSYHSTEYDGIIQEVLDFSDFFKQQLWILISLDNFIDWVNDPFPITSYNAYTNPKYLQLERRDSQYFQSTKCYFMVYIPGAIFSFIMINGLFHVFYNFRISIFIRVYSLWLFLLVIIVNQNMDILTFIAARSFQNLFYFQWATHAIQGASVVAFGMWFIISISIFPMSIYFYGRLSKYFLSNLYWTDYAFLVTTLRFAVKPIVQAVFHAYLYNSPQLQLLLLSLNCLLTFLILIFMELKWGIFLFKIIFLCDCFVQLLSAFLNLFIYLKYYYAQQSSLKLLLEDCLHTIMYMFAAMTAVYLIYALILFFVSKDKNLCCKTDQNETESNNSGKSNMKIEIQFNLVTGQSEQALSRFKISNNAFSQKFCIGTNRVLCKCSAQSVKNKFRLNQGYKIKKTVDK